MAPNGIRPAARMRRLTALAVATGLLAAACSVAATTTSSPAVTVAGVTAMPSATAAPVATPVATPVPTLGPATQQLTLAGPAGAAGALTSGAVRCNLPSTGGLQISVLGQLADPNLSVYIFVWSGNVSVRYDSGAGSTYVERDFTGTGVTGFDAAKGAQIDSPLTEAPYQGAKGNLGVLTSISGSIDCGNQMPGSSTLALSGLTTKGTLSGGLDPVNVECQNGQYGPMVSIIGFAQVDTTSTEVIMSVSAGTFTVYPVGAGFYRNTSTATATLTATGAHVDGDAVEQLAAGSKATPHKVHVTGDVVCGTSIRG